MPDHETSEPILLTLEGNNGKIELMETKVRISLYKERHHLGLGRKFDISKINKVHEIPRDAITKAELANALGTHQFHIHFPGAGLMGHVNVFISDKQKVQADEMIKMLRRIETSARDATPIPSNISNASEHSNPTPALEERIEVPQSNTMDGDVLLTAEGTDAKVELLENIIRIHESSKSGIDTVKEVSIKEIKFVGLKKNGSKGGYFSMNFPGSGFGGKIIYFKEDQELLFEQLRNKIEDKKYSATEKKGNPQPEGVNKNIAKILERRGLSSNDVLIAAEGANGQICLTDKGVIIGREGLGNKILVGFTKGEKFLPYRSIAGVQFKEPGTTWGYIQFTLPGGIERRGGSWDAGSDENTVTFHKDLETFRKIRNIVEERQGLGTVPMSPTPQAPARSSIADELTKLAALKRDGAITEEEYAQLKKDLLSNH